MLLLFALAAFFEARADTVYSCSMGGYEYTGLHYSDTYGMPATKGKESCLERQAMPSDQIGADYRGNHAKLETHLEKMLNDPQCVDYWEILKTYRQRIKTHAENLDTLTKARIKVVEEKVKSIDMQRAFAYLGAFNATCSGGHNRKTSFINLDLINKLPEPIAKPTSISKDGQETESCADVTASGSDHLKGFFVSMKSAKGENFNFEWDPYSVPDQVIIKNGSGKVIYDSGCKGDNPQNLNLSVPSDKKIEVNVVNDCENPVMIGSSWNLRIKCQETVALQCQEPRDELIRLLKQEIELTKKLIDANSLHRECLFYMDEDLLSDLINDGMIEMESSPMKKSVCDTGDEDCEKKATDAKELDKNKTKNLLPYRDPSSDQDRFRCPELPEEPSVFQKVSNRYCQSGWRRLGLE